MSAPPDAPPPDPSGTSSAAPPPPVSPRPATNQVNGRVPAGAFGPPSNRPVDWARWVPEVRLLEAPRIACSPVVVALALAGLLAAVVGDRLICGALGGVNRPARWPWEPAAGGFLSPQNPALRALLAPALPVAAGVGEALSGNGWRTTLAGLARIAWAVAAWGFFGLAVARTAAVRFAAGAGGSPVKAVRLAGSKYVSAVGGPLLPAAGVAALAAGLAVARVVGGGSRGRRLAGRPCCGARRWRPVWRRRCWAGWRSSAGR